MLVLLDYGKWTVWIHDLAGILARLQRGEDREKATCERPPRTETRPATLCLVWLSRFRVAL